MPTKLTYNQELHSTRSLKIQDVEVGDMFTARQANHQCEDLFIRTWSETGTIRVVLLAAGPDTTDRVGSTWYGAHVGSGWKIDRIITRADLVVRAAIADIVT